MIPQLLTPEALTQGATVDQSPPTSKEDVNPTLKSKEDEVVSVVEALLVEALRARSDDENMTSNRGLAIKLRANLVMSMFPTQILAVQSIKERHIQNRQERSWIWND